MKTSPHCLSPVVAAVLLNAWIGAAPVSATDAPVAVGESAAALPKVSSENPLIANFHSLGEIANRTNIYRCANPVGNIVERMKGPEPTEAERLQAKEQMQRLYDSGVRTVVSLQRQDPPTATKKNAEYPAVALEKAAAQEVGLTYVAYSMANSGKNSLQDMSDEEVSKLVQAAGDEIVKRSEAGGVVFHCQSGKDRTGLVAGYLRIKYQHWSLDQALVEMRQNGHVWKKFLKPGNSFSWHEEHLRAMAKTLPASP